VHGEAIATVAVQVKLNEPSSLNVTVLPSVTVPSLSVNVYVDKVESEVQVSSSPTANGPEDGDIVTLGAQSANNCLTYSMTISDQFKGRLIKSI